MKLTKNIFSIKNILVFILLFILLGTASPVVYATDGFRIDVGGDQWINLHGEGPRHVFNLSPTHSIFVPTRSSEEWLSFRMHTPLHVRILTEWSACSVACGGGTQTRSCSGNCAGVVTSQACNTHACPVTEVFDYGGGWTEEPASGSWIYWFTPAFDRAAFMSDLQEMTEGWGWGGWFE